ncbi:MAG: HAMP domain-containing sensor histidine kinase [Woeseiaceae bacterium]|nr:HAMP domain-containing sensor histidine kinase [Woeseiaceae bacterium]
MRKTGIAEGPLSTAQITLICAAISIGVFTLDVLGLPLGVAAGVAYVPAVLVALWYPRSGQTFAVAAATSLLTALGFLFSEPAGVPWMVLANRLLALSAIWLTAIGGRWLVETRRRNAEKDLREARREADKARAAKLRFLLTASNDIRHHLQTLVLLNGALIRTVDDPTAQKMFAGQGDALGHLSDLMNSLLDITDIETGEVTPNIVEFELFDVLKMLNEEFRDKAQAKQLELDIKPARALVRTDRHLLTKMLRSLLSNAIRYTDHGKVAVRCKPVPGGLRITVRDTGIGIADNHLSNIFDEFYRVEQNSAARDVGLGLGLTIVDRIARMLSIKLNVKSKVGDGSKFSLLVPVAAESL